MLSDERKLTSETIVCLVVQWPEARKVCGVVEVKRRDWKCRSGRDIYVTTSRVRDIARPEGS